VGQFVQTNGDYTIKTGEGGTVKFDTGDRIGEVRVTGNLLVEGDTLTVSAENLNVNDNVIILNYGETGNGVTLRYSGVQVDRGTALPASIVYDENDDSWNFANGSPEGIFTWANSRLRTKEILTDSDTDAGDLILIGTGTGVVKVTGTVNYEQQIVDDDHIPNKKYVDDAIQSSPTYQIKSPDTGPYAGGDSGDSRIIIADKHVQPNLAIQPGSLNAFTDQTGYTTFGESAVSVIVDGILNSQFYDNRAIIQQLEFKGNEITNDDTNSNIFIRTQGTGKFQTNYAMQFDEIVGSPAYVPGATVVHACTPSLGGSGLFFVGSTNTNDELVSKNKAILYSMIF
jgi:hypothetical protein